ncbi:hypothetical protein ACQR13_01560 [Bradyrhizobium sp. HKCCYLRH3059]|nr:hypothetical protein [Bradyrhizobium sp. SZCCHNRI1029]
MSACVRMLLGVTAPNSGVHIGSQVTDFDATFPPQREFIFDAAAGMTL